MCTDWAVQANTAAASMLTAACSLHQCTATGADSAAAGLLSADAAAGRAGSARARDLRLTRSTTSTASRYASKGCACASCMGNYTHACTHGMKSTCTQCSIHTHKSECIGCTARMTRPPAGASCAHSDAREPSIRNPRDSTTRPMTWHAKRLGCGASRIAPNYRFGRTAVANC